CRQQPANGWRRDAERGNPTGPPRVWLQLRWRSVLHQRTGGRHYAADLSLNDDILQTTTRTLTASFVRLIEDLLGDDHRLDLVRALGNLRSSMYSLVSSPWTTRRPLNRALSSARRWQLASSRRAPARGRASARRRRSDTGCSCGCRRTPHTRRECRAESNVS